MKRSTVSFARLFRAVICVGVVLAAFAAFGRTAAHAGTVYSISNSLSGTSVQNGWTVAGTIELQDSTAFGTITRSDIKSWQWTASKENTIYSVNSAGPTSKTSFDTSNSMPITATATGLYITAPNRVGDFRYATFDLGQTGDPSNDQDQLVLGWNSMAGPVSVAEFYLFNYSRPPNTLFNVSNMDFLVDNAYGYQFATRSADPSPPPSSVPEIDPASFGSVAALLTGAFGLIEQRRRRRGLATGLIA
jgi:hypothetical protein